MALKLYDTLTPDGDYPLMKAKDVEMPDGTRLSDFKGGGGGSVSWEDVTDKPFGEEQGRAEILAEQELSFTYNANYNAYANDSNPSLFIPVEAQTYIVVWDGKEFTATAFISDAMPGSVLMGNPKALGGEDNGLPFSIGSMKGGYGMTILTEDNSATHRMAVYTAVSVIKPLDPKFLPVATAVDLTAFESEGKIVETYADGSTVTTTMERNAEGKITKITDSNGNVIVLTR